MYEGISKISLGLYAHNIIKLLVTWRLYKLSS